MIPKRKAIIEKAIQLWFNDQYRKGFEPSTNPEYSELLESGYIQLAKTMLMESERKRYAEHDFIDFPESFTVDLTELYESNGLILGSRHTGKSDVAMLISDKAMKDAIVVIFDPSKDWLTRSSIPRFMNVKHEISEIPNKSIIYDISLCSPLESQRIVEDFSKRLFEAQAEKQDRKQYLIILEEAQTYFYQGSMRAKAMQNTVRLLSVGRNVNIAVLLISQFASMLDKFCVKHAMSQVWLGFTKEPNDLRYLKRILGSEVKELTKLADGEFLYSTRKGISKIAINPFRSTVRKTKVLNVEPMEFVNFNTTSKARDNSNNLNGVLTFFLLVMWFLGLLFALR